MDYSDPYYPNSYHKPAPDWKSWNSFFLDATIKIAGHQYDKLNQVEELYKFGLAKLAQPSTQKMWRAMFNSPIANVKQLEMLTDLAPVTIRQSLKQLVQENMVFGNDRQRNRRYYLYDLIWIMKD